MHIFVLQRFLKFALLPCHTWIITSLVKTWLSVLFDQKIAFLSPETWSFRFLNLFNFRGKLQLLAASPVQWHVTHWDRCEGRTVFKTNPRGAVIARARNSRVRENNKLFCFQSYEITCNYANIKFLIWPYELEKDPVASRKFSWSHPLEKSFLYFPLSLCRFISCKSGFLMKPLSVRYREKHRSVSMRVNNNAGRLALVRNGGVSVARCPQGESRMDMYCERFLPINSHFSFFFTLYFM